MKRLALMAAALAVTASAGLAQQTVRMGTEGAYPPYNFINDKGEVDGFEREMGDELCKRAGLTCVWVTNEWDSIIPNLVSGNYDTIVAGMSITAERKKTIDFTQPYLPPTDSAYVGKSADADIKGGTVAAQTSTIQASYLSETGVTLAEYATADETVAAVRSGEVDAVFADKDFLDPIVAASGGELVFVGEPVALGDGTGMGLRQSDAELKGKFDAQITAMKKDGSLNALITKWFGDKAKLW
ncbi:MAG: transporter substrate-binding domain-containing protein [Pseudomonadota bacterium]